MSYAIKNDKSSFRSVATPSDVGSDEYWSELPIEIIPKQPTRNEVENERLRAYADPVIGSDRFFSEAVRLQVMGAGEDEVAAARSAGVARYEEIQAENPWPEDIKESA